MQPSKSDIISWEYGAFQYLSSLKVYKPKVFKSNVSPTKMTFKSDVNEGTGALFLDVIKCVFED